MTRRIWIDTAMMRKAVADKVQLDALALCAMVKLTFADSMVKNASVRRMMKVFHLSYKRCTEAIDEGLSRGYFIKDGDNLRACKIKVKKSNAIPLDIPVNERNGNCPIGIAKMCDQLRGAVVYNHIAKQNDLRDTIRLARDPKRGELKQMRQAKARLRKKGVYVDGCSANEIVRLSYAKVASMLNVSKSKAKTTIKRLREKGLVKRVLQYEEIGMHIDEFSKEVRKSYSKFGGRGFMILCNGMVCLQFANAYFLCGDSLVRFIY